MPQEYPSSSEAGISDFSEPDEDDSILERLRPVSARRPLADRRNQRVENGPALGHLDHDVKKDFHDDDRHQAPDTASDTRDRVREVYESALNSERSRDNNASPKINVALVHPKGQKRKQDYSDIEDTSKTHDSRGSAATRPEPMTRGNGLSEHLPKQSIGSSLYNVKDTGAYGEASVLLQPPTLFALSPTAQQGALKAGAKRSLDQLVRSGHDTDEDEAGPPPRKRTQRHRGRAAEDQNAHMMDAHDDVPMHAPLTPKTTSKPPYKDDSESMDELTAVSKHTSGKASSPSPQLEIGCIIKNRTQYWKITSEKSSHEQDDIKVFEMKRWTEQVSNMTVYTTMPARGNVKLKDGAKVTHILQGPGQTKSVVMLIGWQDDDHAPKLAWRSNPNIARLLVGNVETVIDSVLETKKKRKARAAKV